MDCTAETLTPEEYLACLPEALLPVQDALLLVLSVVVGVSVLFAGVRLVQRAIKATAAE